MKPCDIRQILALTTLLLISAGANTATAAKWAPVDPAELAETAGRVDPESGAEVISREIVVDHADFFLPTEEHHVRIHVFNERGIESVAKIEVPYERGTIVADLAVRTILPDGSTVELDRKEIFSREVLKAGNVRLRVKTFAPAAVRPGAIVEYRYVLKRVPGDLFTALYLQGELPVQRAHCRVRGLGLPGWQMKALFFNCAEEEMKKDKGGFYTFTLTNLKARQDEPFSPPKIHTQASVIFYYLQVSQSDTGKFWRQEGKNLQKTEDKMLKTSPAIAAAASSLAPQGGPARERLGAIYDFCRSKIVNRRLDTVDYTTEERRKLPKNDSPAETLKNGNGEPDDINMLFAALARAAGFEAKLARVNNRARMLVSPEFAEPFTVAHLAAAVRLDGAWTFFDPGATYLPFGMLGWEHTDTYYLMADKEGGVLALHNGPSARESMRRRHAEFSLEENGTLEGTVMETYTGHWEADMKDDLDDKPPEGRIAAIQEEVAELFSRAEVTNVKIDNAADPLLPLAISYKIRIPAFAERVGSRLFVQPAVFQKGTRPLFVNPSRQVQVVFRYRWTENDVFLIKLPEGYSLEDAAAPASQNLGALGSYEVVLGTTRDGSRLSYRRSFGVEAIAFPAGSYESFRLIFEELNRRDNHVVTLRKGGTETAADAGE